MSFKLAFQNLPHSDAIREECERLHQALREEFPEISKVEVNLKQEGVQFHATVHVTGKDMDLASHSDTTDLHDTVVEAFDRAKRQLRKHHDKQIFARRRDAQKDRHSS